MSLSDRLWSANSDLAADALAHPFIRGLGDGSLDREVFAGYVAQDAFFLESFARAYALALARSSDTPTLIALAGLIAGVADELGLHSSYAARWGIDMAGVEPSPATLAYTEFLLATAATSGLGDDTCGDDSVHAPVRVARDVVGRGRGGTVRGVGADLRRPRLRQLGIPTRGPTRPTRRTTARPS